MALEVNGIDSIISADDAGGVRPELNMQKGVHILVKDADASKALTILAELEEQANKPNADKEWVKEERKKKNVSLIKSRRPAAITAAVTFVLGLWLLVIAGDFGFAVLLFIISVIASGVWLSARLYEDKELSSKGKGS